MALVFELLILFISGNHLIGFINVLVLYYDKVLVLMYDKVLVLGKDMVRYWYCANIPLRQLEDKTTRI